MALTKEDIQKEYEKLQTQSRVYKENDEYVKGENPTIIKKDRRKDPDNRLPIPLAKSAVEDMTGYAGSDIEVSVAPMDKENINESEFEEYRNLYKDILDYNKESILTTQLYKEALSHREVYLLFWVTDNRGYDSAMLTPEYAIVGMNEMVVNWNQSLKPEMENAIRFVSDEGKTTTTATVYYPEYAEVWIRTEKTGTWVKTEKKISYPYKSVPVAVFKIAKDCGPLFQAEKPIIDMHDDVISKSQNELDRFNALIALFPGKVTAEFVKKLEELKVIDELGTYDRWPEYLEKNLSGVTEYTNNHLDRLERLFHKSIKVVDFNSIAASGGDESGVARAFKLLGMEFKATEIEKFFTEGFEKRTELINDVIEFSTMGIKVDSYKTVVIYKRNLPIDELNKIQIAEGLKRLGVSDEAVLRILPKTLIEDTEAEAKKMQEKQIEQSKNFAKMLQGDQEVTENDV